MKTLNYAIIGFGGIAHNRIAKEGFACDTSRFKPLRGVRLVGATDLLATRRKVAEAMGLTWYKSAEDVYNDPEIDAVFIATNNLSHASLAKAAIKAGKHCIIDKPIATTVRDAKDISKMAKSRGVSVAVDHMMTKNAYNIMARDLIANNAIGKINDISLHMEFLYGATAAEARTWRCSNPDELGGPVGDVGSHCLYMAEFLLGSPVVSIGCVYYPKVLNIAVEDGAFIKFRLKNGVTGTAKVSFSEPRGELIGNLESSGFEVYGLGGLMRAYAALGQLSGHPDEPCDIILEVNNLKRKREYKVQNPKNIYQQVILEHAKSIVTGALMDGSDAVHNLELVVAAHKSAQKNGKIIEVN